ncbi:transposase B domain protein [Burkholderia pseudomallei MSHR7504]|nr:transposase B domain protein [Burkholderia pseudomallei MSHR7504]
MTPRSSGHGFTLWAMNSPFRIVKSSNGESLNETADPEMVRQEWEAKVLIKRWRYFYSERKFASAHRYRSLTIVRRA